MGLIVSIHVLIHYHRPANARKDVPDEVDGAPCHVQVFTTNLRDEECLQYARIIDACLNVSSNVVS